MFTQQDKYKDNVILKLTFEFALDIIKFCDLLENERKFVLSRQILKSGTSIGANIKEAQNAESPLDFIHKFKIALKEADELEYWLYLCNASDGYPRADQLLEKLQVIIMVATKIVNSTKEKHGRKR